MLLDVIALHLPAYHRNSRLPGHLPEVICKDTPRMGRYVLNCVKLVSV